MSSPEYYQANREKAKARAKAYYEQNRDTVNQKRREKLKKGLAPKSTEYVREWRAKNPTKALALKLKKYGITIEFFNQELERQQGNCKICGDMMAPPNVDHDHTTGAFRGLLCGRCNTAIGLFRDNKENLLSAVAYLESTTSNLVQ